MESNKPADKRRTPKEAVEQHMKDPHHHITDEDIRNLKVGAEAEEDTTLEQDADKKEDKLNSTPGKDDLPNPYTVLDE
jgi:hypothetical protein